MVLGRESTEGLSELFHENRLPAVSSDDADESGESEPNSKVVDNKRCKKKKVKYTKTTP